MSILRLVTRRLLVALPIRQSSRRSARRDCRRRAPRRLLPLAHSHARDSARHVSADRHVAQPRNGYRRRGRGDPLVRRHKRFRRCGRPGTDDRRRAALYFTTRPGIWCFRSSPSSSPCSASICSATACAARSTCGSPCRPKAHISFLQEAGPSIGPCPLEIGWYYVNNQRWEDYMGAMIQDNTTYEILVQLNSRLGPGDAIAEMVALQREFNVFSPKHSLRESFSLLNIVPADRSEKRRWLNFLDHLETYDSDRARMNGHDRIVTALRSNLQSAHPLPVCFKAHSAKADPRVTVTKGTPLIFSEEEYVVISIPTTPRRQAREQAAQRARARRAPKT
jgi:hypothetical protein